MWRYQAYSYKHSLWELCIMTVMSHRVSCWLIFVLGMFGLKLVGSSANSASFSTEKSSRLLSSNVERYKVCLITDILKSS